MTDRVEGDIGVDLDALSDHDLLASMRADVQRANVYHARGLAKMEEFRRRRALDVEARRAVDPHFTLTPIQETVVEVAPLLGLEHGRVRADLRMVRALQVDFPDIWRLCVTGQLDVAKASMVWQAADWNLKHASDLPALAAAITRYLTPDPESGVPGDPDSGVPGSGLPLVTKTRRQLSGRLSYWLAKFDKKSAEDQFRAGFRQRSVRLDTGQGGMGYLSLNHTGPDLLAADYRLTVIAQALRGPQETRTLEQLRADVMLDLLLGRIAVDASTGEFEDEQTGDGRDPATSLRRLPTAFYARPVINVTVPIQTLMGLSDDPATMAGGATLPAGLVRMLAADPDSTWYRMLTDPARGCVELSTHSYKPSAPIWRQVVADYQTCSSGPCERPATTCEIDHPIPYPRGPTSTSNQHPACKLDHKAKHADGFGLVRDDDGTIRLHTRAGFTHTSHPPEQPDSTRWPTLTSDDLDDVTAEEFLDTLSYLRHEREQLEHVAFQHWQDEKEWANYHASYPDATDEDIHAWLNDDDPHNDPAPPILRQGLTNLETRFAIRRAYGDAALT